MRLLVTGVKGQLGFDVVNECKKRGIEAIGVDIDEMDITDFHACKNIISEAKVEAVIHCAAYTAVDAAETNIELCHKVNVDGTANIAKVCRELELKMVYLSTDYVFDGTGERPWKPEDKTAPLNVYGLSKYEGEVQIQKYLERFFIVRIAWVFGVNGNNFIKTMLRLGKENGAVSVVDDQFGSPTYTYDLSRLLVDMVLTDNYGIYHATNEGICSWYEFALEIFKQAGIKVTVTPVDSSSFSSKAKRPKNSRMCKEKLDSAGFIRLPSWQDALSRYLQQIK